MNQYRILIAEDDAHTRAALAELARGEGYNVTEVGDGMTARRAIEKTRFDLLCLDVMMPMTNGYDLCRWVRSRDQRLPIIFITAKGDEIDKVVGFELGADDYISKPFGSHEVLARIKAVLRRCQKHCPQPNSATEPITVDEATAQSAFTMFDLTIEPARLCACRGEETIRLTLRELQILTMLHRAQGEVVSRRAIYQACWDAKGMPNSRTVDQTVSQLRKRIEVDAKHPKIIQTVYGVGYRYDERDMS